MAKHAKPRPIEPWKVPLFLIWATIGLLFTLAVTGSG